MTIALKTIASVEFVAITSNGKTVTLPVDKALDHCRNGALDADAQAAAAEKEAIELSDALDSLIVAGRPASELRGRIADIKTRHEAATTTAAEHRCNAAEIEALLVAAAAGEITAAAESAIAQAVEAHPVPEMAEQIAEPIQINLADIDNAVAEQPETEGQSA
ncbi:MAG: hypothetical protein JNJ81_11180 [Candidatus Accumulibacter sp.]|nr:hypothetical protein [Accumulibacter sp.]